MRFLLRIFEILDSLSGCNLRVLLVLRMGFVMVVLRFVGSLDSIFINLILGLLSNNGIFWAFLTSAFVILVNLWAHRLDGFKGCNTRLLVLINKLGLLIIIIGLIFIGRSFLIQVSSLLFLVLLALHIAGYINKILCYILMIFYIYTETLTIKFF